MNVHRSPSEVPVILVRCQSNLIYFHRLSKNPQICYFIKIRPVRAKLFLEDRQTDRQTDTKLTFSFRTVANAPKKTKQKPFIYSIHRERRLGTAAVHHTQHTVLSCQYSKLEWSGKIWQVCRVRPGSPQT
jgi:hypothetical protein